MLPVVAVIATATIGADAYTFEDWERPSVEVYDEDSEWVYRGPNDLTDREVTWFLRQRRWDADRSFHLSVVGGTRTTFLPHADFVTVVGGGVGLSASKRFDANWAVQGRAIAEGGVELDGLAPLLGGHVDGTIRLGTGGRVMWGFGGFGRIFRFRETRTQLGPVLEFLLLLGDDREGAMEVRLNTAVPPNLAVIGEVQMAWSLWSL